MPTATLDTLSTVALRLSEAERYVLAARLLDSVEGEADVASVDAAWDNEIQARLWRYEASETKTTPADRVFEDLEKIYRRKRWINR